MAVTALCAFVFIKLTPYAFPIVHIDLTMDKNEALLKAREISKNQKLGPLDFKQTASFETDSYVNNFVELEGGGKEALSKMISEGLYQPYTWVVRHFEPLDIHELVIQLTPQGVPYGFVETISDDPSGPNVTPSEAQKLASTSVGAWNINLDDYELVETSKQENLSKRLDHTFVYQRKNTRIGDAPLRLRLVVRGNRLVELLHFVQVPDEFGRRYEQMRSLNEALTWASGIAVVLLYILAFGLVGFIFLIKQRYLLWRGPIFCAGIIALLSLLSKFNNIPQIWMNYNTALAPHSFLANYVIISAYQFVFFWAIYSFIFIVAEGLTRKAFPEQLQISKIWSSRNASSLTVWARTFSGYFLVFVSLAFQVVFYIITSRYLHWWIPSESLFSPNILGTYVPWLEPISQALTAGTVEECLFRAIPLASAALLGARYGHRKSFIVIAFILQALIFGAAHANYPMQPAYARIVELFFIAMIFGGLYLSLGLLPAIINHVIFDIVLMSMPIFMASGTAVYINQAIIILISCIPIFVLIYARLKQGSFRTPTLDDYNKSFKTSTKYNIFKSQHITTSIISMPRKLLTTCFILGLAGVLACIFLSLHTDAPALTLSRAEALKIANEFLKNHSVELSEDFKPLSVVNSSSSVAHNFIWQEGGGELFEKLLGNYLTPAHWFLRYAKFSGNVEERAEEYQIYVNQKGQVFRFFHQLPEALAGARLNEEEARKIAHAALSRELLLEPQKLSEISAISSQLPARSDWIFVFADPGFPLSQGRAEISVRVAGDELVGFARQIHVPQEYLRKEQSREQRALIITLVSVVPICAVFLIGLVLAFGRLIFIARSRKLLAIIFIPLAVLLINNIFNAALELISAFNTTQSFEEQLFMGFAGSILMSLIKASVFALMLSFILIYKSPRAVPKNYVHACSALCLGVFLYGIELCVLLLVPSKAPTLNLLNGLGSYLPVIASLNTYLFEYLFTLIFLVLVLMFFNKYNYMPYLLLFLCGFIISGLSLGNNIPLFLSLGLVRALFFMSAYYLAMRFDYALVPLALAAYYTLMIMQESMFVATGHALTNACIVSLIILGISFVLFRTMNNPKIHANLLGGKI